MSKGILTALLFSLISVACLLSSSSVAAPLSATRTHMRAGCMYEGHVPNARHRGAFPFPGLVALLGGSGQGGPKAGKSGCFPGPLTFPRSRNGRVAGTREAPRPPGARPLRCHVSGGGSRQYQHPDRHARQRRQPSSSPLHLPRSYVWSLCAVAVRRPSRCCSAY